MELSDGNLNHAKRKRSGQYDTSMSPAPQDLKTGPAIPNNSIVAPRIDYFVRRAEPIPLIDGDSPAFNGYLKLIEEYEASLVRKESLAAVLGGKLTGRLLLESFEKMFKSNVKVLSSYKTPIGGPVSWIEVVREYRDKPHDFKLTQLPDDSKVCIVWIRQQKIEISEDDFRLIVSGAPGRYMPDQPVAEDEAAEMATIDILDQRLSGLIRSADKIASRARQLNYRLKTRKAAMKAASARHVNGETPCLTAIPHAAAVVSSPTSPFISVSNGDLLASSLHQDLLHQFSTAKRSTSPTSLPRHSNPDVGGSISTTHGTGPGLRARAGRLHHPHHGSGSSTSPAPHHPPSPLSLPHPRTTRASFSPTNTTPIAATTTNNVAAAPIATTNSNGVQGADGGRVGGKDSSVSSSSNNSNSVSSTTSATTAASKSFGGDPGSRRPSTNPNDMSRPAVLVREGMTAHLGMIARGQAIWPPCDRCRRLGLPCVKNLTACTACTRKHCRCTWKQLLPDEHAAVTAFRMNESERLVGPHSTLAAAAALEGGEGPEGAEEAEEAEAEKGAGTDKARSGTAGAERNDEGREDEEDEDEDGGGRDEEHRDGEEGGKAGSVAEERAVVAEPLSLAAA